MTLPNYKRPFDPGDFRGYFKWTKVLTKKLKGNFLYHACHREDLTEILDKNELTLRSSWSIKLPEHGLCKVPGVWSDLNYYVNGNHYGPFLIQFPLSVLDGKQFMAFRRGGQYERNRYFFVQYEAMIPIYSFKGNVWRRVNSEVYFDSGGDKNLQLKNRAIYDIILTIPVSLAKAISMYGVKHSNCIPNKCEGTSVLKSRKIMRRIAKKDFKNKIYEVGIIEDLIEKYPDIEGETIKVTIE